MREGEEADDDDDDEGVEEEEVRDWKEWVRREEKS